MKFAQRGKNSTKLVRFINYQEKIKFLQTITTKFYYSVYYKNIITITLEKFEKILLESSLEVFKWIFTQKTASKF